MDITDLVPTVCLISDPLACCFDHLCFETHGSLQRTLVAPAQIAK